MPIIVLSSYKLSAFPEGGGHFWVYLQYALGLQQLGCDIYWLEAVRPQNSPAQEAAALATFRMRMQRFGLDGKLILYRMRGNQRSAAAPPEYLDMTPRQAEAIFERADLLLNFHYAISPAVLGRFRRTALVDIDPGLLQFWISHGQLSVPRHDFYFTTGETVGTPAARFPDCGLQWNRLRPPVCLDRWPCVFEPRSDAFTTVSLWDSSDWLAEDGELYDNTKRIAFLGFADLPRHTSQPLELALYLCTDIDRSDRKDLERRGWRIRDSRHVAGTPELYREYIQGSRGEFSCAKPSCLRFQNAWVSDRTLCYLASGKPVVVQDTGPSAYLPNGPGMFRFSTMEQAVSALEAINANYERHCRAAREIAEAYFDSRQVAESILDRALSRTASAREAAVKGAS